MSQQDAGSAVASIRGGTDVRDVAGAKEDASRGQLGDPARDDVAASRVNANQVGDDVDAADAIHRVGMDGGLLHEQLAEVAQRGDAGRKLRVVSLHVVADVLDHCRRVAHENGPTDRGGYDLGDAFRAIPARPIAADLAVILAEDEYGVRAVRPAIGQASETQPLPELIAAVCVRRPAHRGDRHGQ